MTEYTPPERQLISHEVALALEFEQLIEGLYEEREAGVAARKRFMDGVRALLEAPVVREPVVMNQQQWEDILRYEEGVRMKDDTLLIRRVIRNGANRSSTGPVVASARELRRFGMDKKPVAPATYTKRNRKSKR